METYRPVGNGMGREGRNRGAGTPLSPLIPAKAGIQSRRRPGSPPTRGRAGASRAHVFLLARLTPSELCQIPPVRGRSADRRGVQRHPIFRAGHKRPTRPRAGRLSPSARRGTLASRRSTAAVYWPRARQGDAFGRWPDAAGVLWLRRVHSHDPLVVADGRCCPGASRATGCMTRLAGRRIPACLKRCLATSTLGGRNTGTLVIEKLSCQYMFFVCSRVENCYPELHSQSASMGRLEICLSESAMAVGVHVARLLL
jgi:hypothetical protein